jgi:uncharacterized protein YjbI with pentapeptide repeats
MRAPFESWSAARRHAEAAARTEPRGGDPDTTLARANQVAQVGRTIWLGLMAFLAFIVLTLVSVRDIDFFSLAATIDLPLVNIAIPTTVFFWSAAWLASAFHAFLQIHLLKLWDPLAALPDSHKGAPVAEALYPWIVIDWALRRRPDADRATRPRPLAGLADLAAVTAVWLAAPAVIAAFWWRSMPALDERLTLVIAGALALAIYTSLNGFTRASTLLGHGEHPPRLLAFMGSAPGRARLYDIGLLALLAISWMRTESFDRMLWSLAAADLRNADLAGRPADWADYDIARRRFRVGWCADHAIPPEACHAPVEEDFEVETNWIDVESHWIDEIAFAQAQTDHRNARTIWCENGDRGRTLDAAACTARFAALDRAFNIEWQEQRKVELATLQRPPMAGRDLRGADATGAFLVGLDFSGSRLEGADFSTARMEGADLVDAHLGRAKLIDARLEAANLVRVQLIGADLSSARLVHADLRHAFMETAILREARLERAILSHAGLGGANLFRAQMQDAKLDWAWLKGAILREARLKGADLSGARLEGAILSKASFEAVRWTGAKIGASPAHKTDFSNARDLTQGQLDLVIGDNETILPPGIHVQSCWAEAPANFDDMIASEFSVRLDWLDDEIGYNWVCGPLEAPMPVGTPAPE